MTTFIRSHRRCGCDCRDATSYAADSATFNPLFACPACGGMKPPCHWLVHFGCDIKCGTRTIATAELRLQAVCPFNNSCTFVSLEQLATFGPPIGHPGGIISPVFDCTWTGGRDDLSLLGDGASTPVPAWIMNTNATPVTYTYDLNGVSIHFQADAAFDCSGPNTFSLVSSSGACGPIPNKICITPVEPVHDPLYPELSGATSDGQHCGGEGAAYQQSDYDTEADREACCDPNCDIMGAALWISGGSSTETSSDANWNFPSYGSGASKTGAPAGRMSPSGPSRVLFAYGGTSHTEPFAGGCRAVLYCSRGTWYADMYDSTSSAPTTWIFLFTLTLTTTCCPLQGCSGSIDLPHVTGVGLSWKACVCIGPGAGLSDCNSTCTGHCHYVAARGTSTETSFGVGTSTWTAPQAGILEVQAQGGGGAGGSGQDGYVRGGAGGGGGGQAVKTIVVASGASISISIGSNGPAGQWAGGADTSGGDGGTVSVSGAMSISATGGVGGQGQAGTTKSGAGGNGSGGDSNLSGGNGLAAGAVHGGHGGSSPDGAPGGIGGDTGVAGSDGIDGTIYGGGGGGGGHVSADDPPSVCGGLGGNPICRVTFTPFVWTVPTPSNDCAETCSGSCAPVDDTFLGIHGNPTSEGATLELSCT